MKSTRGTARPTCSSNAASTSCLAGYTRGLDFVLGHQRATLATFLITVAATVFLYVYIPKGFFPQQDTGIIAGLTDAPQDISFDEMVRRQHALTDVVAKDPDVASYGTGIGGSRPINNGFVITRVSSRATSAAPAPTRSSPDCGRRSRKVPGATLFLQAAQDLNVGGRTSRTQYQYTLQDADIDELNEWAPKLLAACRSCPCCATSPPISRPAAACCRWRSIAIRRRVSASSRR